MNKSCIELDELKRLLHYDLQTGAFTWKIKTCRKVVPGVVVGYIRPDGYRIITVNKIRYRANRLAWFYVTGEWPKFDVDHIDGNTRNDAFNNLRDVTTAQNVQNQKFPHKRNKTGGFLGVSKQKNRSKWRARICTNGKTILLGTFNTPEEANEAYLKAKRINHSTCTI